MSYVHNIINTSTIIYIFLNYDTMEQNDKQIKLVECS